MSEKPNVPLLGRLAIQLKMMNMDQLRQATVAQGREPEHRLGDIFVELGLIDPSQLEKLNKVQRDLVIKHRAKQAMSGQTVPERELPRARQTPAVSDAPGPLPQKAEAKGIRAPDIEPPPAAPPAAKPEASAAARALPPGQSRAETRG
jgi:hypothetical protein